MLYPDPSQAGVQSPWAAVWGLRYSSSTVLLPFLPPPWPQVYMFKLVMASLQCSFEWNWETVERDEIQVRSRKCNMQREMGRRTTFYFFQCCCVCKDVFGGCLLRLYLSTISITGSNSTKWIRSRHAMTGSSERYS